MLIQLSAKYVCDVIGLVAQSHGDPPTIPAEEASSALDRYLDWERGVRRRWPHLDYCELGAFLAIELSRGRLMSQLDQPTRSAIALDLLDHLLLEGGLMNHEIKVDLLDKIHTIMDILASDNGTADMILTTLSFEHRLESAMARKRRLPDQSQAPREEMMIKIDLEGTSHEIEMASVRLNDLVENSRSHRDPDCPIVGARVDGEVVDLTRSLVARPEPYVVELLNTDMPEGLMILRHSASHLMSQAVKRLFGDKIELGVGPPTDDGFYQDYALPELSEEDFPRIEAAMQKIVDEDNPFERDVISREEALRIFGYDRFKQELIEDIGADTVSIYRQREYVDLCRGSHVPSSGYVRAFKLLRVSGAYWRGDAARPQLQRIYGIAFATRQQLDADLHRRAEAERRDHRRLGATLGLFLFSDLAPGAPVFLPDGTIVYNQLIDLKRQLMRKWGYSEIRTPALLRRKLWEESGHWLHYRENMFTLKVDDEDFAIKPMNCPGSTLVYRAKPRSYRELPLRLGEFGYVHRNELSGVLAGLLRVRAFTQDDAHLYVAPEQIEEEVGRTIRMFQELYSVFGFPVRIALSTRPTKRMGDERLWEQAEDSLRRALASTEIDYDLKAGEGAFYGPKIDFQVQDCVGREWQCGTIQVDFQMPERFDLHYVDPNGKKCRPVIIHPATMGSIERFMAILIEEFEGHFPSWLAPCQVTVMPVSNKFMDYAEEVVASLQARGLRSEVDASDETLGRKIRAAHQRRIPYMVIVGGEEARSRTVSLRDRAEKERRGVALDRFVDIVYEDVTARRRQPLLVDEISA